MCLVNQCCLTNEIVELVDEIIIPKSLEQESFRVVAIINVLKEQQLTEKLK